MFGNLSTLILGDTTARTNDMIKTLIARLRKLAKNEDGVTAMEYGLIAAATVVAISAFMPGITTRLSGIFSGVSNVL